MSGMEALLMGGDSSSGESDDEVNVPMGATAAAAVAAVPAPVPAPAPAPAPVPAPAPAPPPRQQPPAPAPAPKGKPSNADQMARLKSLYASQPKREPGSAASTPQQPSAATNRPPQAAVPAPAPATGRPLMPNRPHHQSIPPQQQPVPARQPQQQIPQPVPQQMPPQQHHQRRPQQMPPPQQQRTQQMPPTQQPPSQSQHYAHSTSASSSHRRQSTEDPFAPTPLHRIKERASQMSSQPPQQTTASSSSRSTQAQPHVSQGRSMPSSSAPGGSSSRTTQARAPADRAAMERDVRRQKEKFLMFTRVLIKYLEQKDAKMHQQAKMIIKDCAERNKRQEPGYESVTASMKERLKKLVGDQYWKRAEAYLKHFLEQKKSPLSGSSSTKPVSTTGASSSSSSHQRHGYSGSSSQSQSHSSSSAQRHAEQEKARQLQAKQRGGASSSSSAAAQQAAPTIANLRQEIANQRQAISKGTPKSGSSSGTPATPTTKSSSSSKKSSSAKRKSGSSTPNSASRSKSSGAAAAAAATPAPAPPVAAPAPAAPPEPEEMPPREYKEFMEMLEHAIDYDWSSAGLLLGSKTDIQLDDEQKGLLYGESKTTPKPAEAMGPFKGWGKHNLLSERAAWARVRLREHKASRSAPVVGGGLLTLPGGAKMAPSSATAWVNEEKAEQDTVLAMLSEACEMHIKGALEKAIQCARQRQNLDGIRLWHQQHSTPNNTTRPPLAVRLGADVTRQVARAHGNAAMTSKRMEQALERQSDVPSRERVLKGETLVDATSMADLAMRPMLAKGVENADYHGKRAFEISGGKRASEPPLGRVPKVAKLEVVDFVMGSNLSEGVGRHRAATAMSSIFF